MNKYLVVFGAFFTIMLLVSTVTAVPQVHCEPVMKIVNEVEEKKTLIREKIENFSDKLDLKLIDVEPEGIIDIIIALLQLLINLVNTMFQFILDLFGLYIDLIMIFVNAFIYLINIIVNFISSLIEIFIPDYIANSYEIDY